MIRLRSAHFLNRLYSTSADLLPKSQSPLVSKLKFFNSVNVNGDGSPIPTYRVMDGVGNLIEGAEAPEIDEALGRRIYENMLLLPTLDTILYNVQRQGKISFYMTAHGEEATIIGSAAALANNDEVFGQYREMGVLLWRGFSLDSVMDQCFGNEDDTSGRGKQMPVHFGSTEHHFHTISSPLATQIPQAAGAAYALSLSRPRTSSGGNIVDGKADWPVAACYFGEGAASEGDFHAGMLLSSVVPSPTVFIVRNNGFAISTPSNQQYFGDGIASRGPGYGVDTIRVDGNDVLAVLNAVREARRRCEAGGRGVLVECMTYRVGHHSTSDDSFAYRQRSEVEGRKNQDNPIVRFRNYLQSRGWWSDEEEEATKKRLKDAAMQAFKRAENKPRSRLGELFEDAYAKGDMPWNIKEQKAELSRLLNKYGATYEPWKKELSKFRDAGKDVMKDS